MPFVSKFIQLLLILLTTVVCLHSQNLVPNPNFEIFSSCPTSISQLNLAVPWITPTEATPDYFHSCTMSIAVDVPTNFGGGGYQFPLTGNAYSGCYFYSVNNYREYIQVELNTPLEEGICYHVGFFMNLVNQYCGVNQAGIYISVFPPSSMNDMVLPVEPQITGNGGFYSDTVAWVEISGQYPAQGGEQYITIGNFKNNMETIVDPMCPNQLNISYYYVDSVYVIETGPVEELPLELGPPIEACIEHEIDGESGDVMYEWSDGSHGHTLTVTTTDTYSLTITDGCMVGIDSVEVTILGSAPVEINPGFVTICEGETYTITLDPDAGDYIWNDGTTDNEYTITEPGLYSVTLDDGCEISSDDIIVDVMLLPLPISLGNDTILCIGDAFEITLDPGMNTVEWQDGSNELTYTISDPGIYAVTISNVCGEVNDEIEVTGLQEPQIDLGPDTIVWCDGNVIEYDFDPDLGEFLWSDDSFDPVFFIFSSGIYSVTVTNECGTTQDMVNVYEAVQPHTGLGDTIELCASALPYTLSVEEFSSVDNFIWSSGETTSQIVISNPGAYSVTVSNICFSVSDTVYLDIITAPVPALPDTEVMCLGDTLLIDANIPFASYLWQDGSTLSTFEVTGPGLYSVTATNACGVGQDTIVVTAFIINDPPYLGPDLSLCPGEQVTLYANVENGTFLWNDMSTADSLLVSTPGLYSLTVQEQCAQATDTILITYDNSPPEVDLPSSLSLCQGQVVIIASNVSGVNYLWNDGTDLPTLTVNVPGTYSLTISNACGSDVDTVVVLDGGASPTVSLGSDISLCPGETLLINPSSTDVASWIWQDGSTAANFTVADSGWIDVTVANACGISHDTLHVNLLDAVPVLDLGLDTALCPGESTVLAIANPNVGIIWSDGSSASTLTVSAPGNYFATISNSCGASSDTMNVAALAAIPTLDLGPDLPLCPGELITLSPGIEDVTYQWQDGSTDTFFIIDQNQTVALTISNECGTSADTLLVFTSTNGPDLVLGEDILACEGQTVTIMSNISGVDFMWQDGSTAPTYLTSTSGTFYLQVSNSCGVDIDTIMVDIHGTAPTPELGSDTTLCEGNTLTLISNADSETTVTWQNGSTLPNLLVSAPGTYYLMESNRCGDNADTINISYQSLPITFDLGGDTILCPGETLTLNVPLTSDDIHWQDGTTSQTYLASQQGTYSLTLSNKCGVSSDELELIYDDQLIQFPIENEVTLCEGDQVTLDASQSISASYLWNTSAITPSISILTPGVYSVTVITECQEASNEIIVNPDVDCIPSDDFYIPTVFSPNGDFINDVFTIHFGKDVEVVGMQGSVFDRWGNLIFSSEEIPFTWDGKFGDDEVMPGVYVYKIEVSYKVNSQEHQQRFAGDVTILK